MNDREAFERAIREKPDDYNLALVFADWLDDHQEYDYATRMRSYPEAHEWLVEFVDKYDPTLSEEDEVYERHLGYEGVLAEARAAIIDGSYSFSLGSNDTLCDALRENRSRFWRNVSVVTGLPAPPNEYTGWFNCAC